MRPRSGFIVIAVTMAVILGAGTALANVIEYNTSLSASASPSGPVDPGTQVRIKGQLSSERAKCERGSRIQLVLGGDTVDRDRTNANGKYVLVTTVDSTSTFRVVFAGKVLNAEHPHRHTCDRSSARVRVVVS